MLFSIANWLLIDYGPISNWLLIDYGPILNRLRHAKNHFFSFFNLDMILNRFQIDFKSIVDWLVSYIWHLRRFDFQSIFFNISVNPTIDSKSIFWNLIPFFIHWQIDLWVDFTDTLSSILLMSTTCDDF